MATVNCPKCSHRFDPSNNLARGGGAVAGATAGALLGGEVGIVAGPLGGIAGTVPGAIIGGLLGFLGVAKFAKCPGCGDVFTT